MTGLTQLLAGNNSNPNFSWVTNNNFRAALTEAAYSGLVMGFAGPASPQYWLRGVSYPNFLGSPGASYTRTGNRAGLDATVIYPANVPRIAPSVGPGPELIVNGGFSSAANWILADSAAISSGSLTLAAVSASRATQLSIPVVIGRLYIASFDVTSNPSGTNVRLDDDGGGSVQVFLQTTTVGSFTAIFRAQTSSIRAINTNGIGTATIDNISIREFRDAGSGLRVFGAGTNQARNSTATGGTVGVIGSGGVLPTNWTRTPSGLTVEIVSIVGEAVQLRYSGTPTGTFVDIGVSNAANAAAVPSQIWTGSRFARLVAGTLPAAASGAFDVTIHRFDSGGAYIGESSSFTNFSGSTFVRGTHTSAALPAGTASIATYFRIYVNNGVPCDFTVEIASPQLEQSAFVTDYIPNPNTGASSSAGADDATIGTAAGVNLGADHAILIEGIVPDLIAGAFPTLIGWSASSLSTGVFIDSAGRIGVNAGGSTINLGGGPFLIKGQVARALFRVSGGNTGRLFVNGVAAFANTAFTPSTGLTSLFLGQTPTKTELLRSSLNIAAILPRAPSDAECLAMTAL